MSNDSQSDLMKGTLDMLVLRAVRDQVLHGFAIARAIQAASDEYLKVEEGSLYPALHRLERRGWVASEWGRSENNRRAKFYRITPAGKKQLQVEVARWNQMVGSIAAVIAGVNREVGHGLD
jgi:transcriptional regulator